MQSRRLDLVADLTGFLLCLVRPATAGAVDLPPHRMLQDNSGSLDRAEVVRALIKTVPSLSGDDEHWLDETFCAIWAAVDPNNDGEEQWPRVSSRVRTMRTTGRT